MRRPAVLAAALLLTAGCGSTASSVSLPVPSPTTSTTTATVETSAVPTTSWCERRVDDVCVAITTTTLMTVPTIPTTVKAPTTAPLDPTQSFLLYLHFWGPFGIDDATALQLAESDCMALENGWTLNKLFEHAGDTIKDPKLKEEMIKLRLAGIQNFCPWRS